MGLPYFIDEWLRCENHKGISGDSENHRLGIIGLWPGLGFRRYGLPSGSGCVVLGELFNLAEVELAKWPQIPSCDEIL